MSNLLGFVMARELVLRETQDQNEANRLGLLGAVAGPAGAVAAASIVRDRPAVPAGPVVAPEEDKARDQLSKALQELNEAITAAIADASTEATENVAKTVAACAKTVKRGGSEKDTEEKIG